MSEQGVSKVALARCLGVNERAVRRLLDLDHASQIDRLEQALASLGRTLQVTVRPRELYASGLLCEVALSNRKVLLW